MDVRSGVDWSRWARFGAPALTRIQRLSLARRSVLHTKRCLMFVGPKTQANLDSTYSYLGGNAFGRDNKGRVTKDDSALSSEIAAAALYLASDDSAFMLGAEMLLDGGLRDL